MFGIKKNSFLIVILIFILFILCVQTVPRIQYSTEIRRSNIVELEALIKKYPAYPEAYILLAEKYSKSMPEKSEYYYGKAKKIVNNKKFSAAMDEYTALAYLKHGNPILAANFYSNPILVKYNSATNLALANILCSLGRFDDALYVLNSFEKNTFLSIASSEPDMFTRMRYEFFYNILLTVDNGLSSKAFIFLAKGYTYYEKGEYDKALKMVNDYLKISDNIPAALLLRIYTAKGDLESAQKYNALINKIHKNKNVADNFSQGLYLIAAKDYKKAENIFIKMTEKQKSVSSMQYGLVGLGILNMYRENYTSAIKYLEKALELKPYEYDVIVKLAECYKKTGDVKNFNKYNLKLKALLAY